MLTIGGSSQNQTKYNYKGYITDFNIWNESLTLEEMINITSSCNKPSKIPHILNWSDITTEDIKGPENLNFTEEVESCINDNNVAAHIVPVKMARNDAFKACSLLGGTMIVTSKHHPFSKIINKNGNYTKSKCDNYKEDFIAPLQYIFKDDALLEYPSNKTYTLSNLTYADGQGIQQCVRYKPESGIMDDEICDSLRCSICMWEGNVKFVLKGLPKDSKIDKKYMLVTTENHQGNLIFYGYEFTNILFDPSTDRWIILEKEQEGNVTILGYYKPTSDLLFYPVGVKPWNLMELGGSDVVSLKLTLVCSVFSFK